MEAKRFSERKLILFTVVLMIAAGLIRLLSYKVGVVLFYLSFLPFIVHRLMFYRNHRGKLADVDKRRRVTLALLLLMMLLNMVGWQNVEFILLIILAVDYMLISNRRSNGEKADDFGLKH
jgi:hypothetical protein